MGDIHICEVLIEQTSLVGTSESETDGEVKFLFLVAAASGNGESFREIYVFYLFEIEEYAHLSCLYFKISLAVQCPISAWKSTQ